MNRLPFSFIPVRLLRKFSHIFLGFANKIQPNFSFLRFDLQQAGLKFSANEYLAMCLFSTLSFFSFILFIFAVILYKLQVNNSFLISLVISFIISILVFMQQVAYPKLLTNKKIKSLERNLLPALQNLLIQLNSGVTLFNILVNISSSNYDEISKEFRKAVKEINAGKPQIEVLEGIATNNPSILFRRAIWQIVNGMKSGSDMATVINEIINNLSEQQIIEIQKYGNQLSPLAMFYMLLAVILPSLSLTFIIIISSFIGLIETTVRFFFLLLFALVLFFQIMFLGIIKSKRPNLLT